MGERPGTSPVFVGRTEERATLVTCLDAAARGRGAAGFVSGEAGIGKTTLLNDVATEAAGRGFTCFRASGDELARTLPFGIVIEALACMPSSHDPARAAIGRMVAGTEEAADQHQIVEALVALVESITHEAPALLTLEDLHWADASTLLTIRMLAKRLSHEPLALLCSFRPSPHIPELPRLARSLDGATVLELSPLPDREVDELVRALAGAPPGPGLTGQLRRTGGNPLFVTELIGALEAEGAITSRDGVADVTDRSLPPSLARTILNTVTILPADAINLLRSASILGSNFSVRDLVAVTGRDAADLDEPLREAIRASILVDSGDRLAFRHDLVRESIYHDIAGGMRAQMHLEAARALARTKAPAAQVAAHFAMGARQGDVEAVDAILQAATELEDPNPLGALELRARAHELVDRSDERWEELLLSRVQWLDRSGRPGEAIELTRARLRELGPRETVHARGVIAAFLHRSGLSAAALDELPALEDAAEGEDVPDEIRAWAYSVSARIRSAFDPAAAEELARKGFEIEEAARNPPGMKFGHVSLAWISLTTGPVQEAIEHGRAAVEITDPGGPLHAGAEFVYGVALAEADRHDEGLAHIRTGLELIGRGASGPEEVLFATRLGHLLMLRGAWDDAVVELDRILSEVDEHGGRFPAFASACRALIGLHTDELSAADRILTHAERAHDPAEPPASIHLVWWVRGLLHDAGDRAPEALAALRRAWDLPRVFPPSDTRLIGPDLVRMALATGDDGLARQVAEDVAGAAQAAGDVASVGAAALRCRAMVERDPAGARAAAEAYGENLLERALACELAADLGADDAVGLLKDASELYAGMGAHRSMQRVAAALRARGVRRGGRTRARARTGWAALSPTEEQVARLAAEGLTTAVIAERMFVSPHTVKTHLSHIFSKLGLASRVELARAYAERSA